MDTEVIIKSSAELRCRPNVADPTRAARSFTWAGARADFPALAGGRFNLAVEAVDRHVAAGRGARTALRFVAADDGVRTCTYAELADQAHRLARVLLDLKIESGQRVATWLGREPAFVGAVLGALQAGAVSAPLSDHLAPETLAARLAVVEARVLVTTRRRYLDTVRALRERLPDLACVLLVDGEARDEALGVRALGPLLAAAPASTPDIVTGAGDTALLHFTRGTTGRPKAILYAHEAIVAHAETARTALDLHPDDMFCCSLDPTSALGLAYGLLAPLVLGVTAVIDQRDAETDGDVDRIYALLQNQRVTVWCTTPAVIARLRAADWRTVKKYDLRRLRFIATLGDRLEPSAIAWSRAFLGQPLHEQWAQAETGAILLANLAAAPLRPGCLGRPLPGVEAAVVQRTAGGIAPVLAAEAEGELALRAGWPSLFKGFVGDPGRAAAAMVDGWYLTGDRVRRDAAGDYWFLGRLPPQPPTSDRPDPSAMPPTDRSPVHA